MEYYIDEFFIDIDRHRQGIGSKLMNSIKELIKQKGLKAIMLNTERGYPSRFFYESLGFEIEKSMIILDIGV